MLCPKCQKNIDNNAIFCPQCSYKIECNIEQEVSQQTTSEKLSKKFIKNNPIKPFLQNFISSIKRFVGNYKKQCIISITSLVVLIIGVILFNNFVDFTKLSWNKEYSDNNLSIVTQTNVKLGVNFSDERNIEKIKYSSNCGKVKNDGLEILWDLTDNIGKCEITATYKMQKISKEYNVIPFDINREDMFLDSDDDTKIDDEWNVIPKEYELGTYAIESNGVKINITGKGNIDSTIATINENTKISNKVGLIDKLYSFYTKASMTEAKVTIPYTPDELKQYRLNEDNLSIYYYNVEENKYEKVQTIIDKANKTITATLKHFSHYVVGDTDLVKQSPTSQILFILDNSWSLYTNEQYKEITGKDYNPSLGEKDLDGFDAEGKRFELTKELIKKLEKSNYKFGLSEFRQDYTNASPLGSSIESINSRLDDMYGNFITFTPGTNITGALKYGMKEFSRASDYKYIVILTDGQDSTLTNNASNIIKQALDNDIKICSIGFGNGKENLALASISVATGCKSYSSANSNGLIELFDNLGTELDNDLVDIDNDGKTDGVLIADSGFIANRDGFSFQNYGTNLSSGGHCYGMATFAQLYYKKVLPLNVGKITAKESTSYAYDLTNTYFKNYSNLYDYKLKTNELKYTFGFDYFYELNPPDLRVVENDSLVYNIHHRSAIEKSGMYKYKEAKESSLNKTEQLKKYGFNYSTYVDVLLNEDSMQTSSVIDNNDKQLFNAIYAAHIKQNTRVRYSSGETLITWIVENVSPDFKLDYSNGPGFINILKSKMDDKDAPVITSLFSGGNHAVNAISLVQDIENPNYYYIGVYDNNYPGEKRYVDLECKKDTCLTKENSYYSSSKEPIYITPLLEYDLAYYK